MDLYSLSFCFLYSSLLLHLLLPPSSLSPFPSISSLSFPFPLSFPLQSSPLSLSPFLFNPPLSPFFFNPPLSPSLLSSLILSALPLSLPLQFSPLSLIEMHAMNSWVMQLCFVTRTLLNSHRFVCLYNCNMHV